MKLDQDWHIHTHRSKCGKPDNTVAAIVQVLDASGIRCAGLSDHIDERTERDWFAGVAAGNRADLAGLQSRPKILVGTEATMLSPARCALDADLADELDFVIVACNHYHLDIVENPDAATPQAYADHYLDMVQGAIDLGFADIIAHPFLHNKLGLAAGLDALERYDETRLQAVLRAAADAATAFEINPRQVQHAIPWYRNLVLEARRCGARFTLGSDAHTLADLGYRPVGDAMAPEVVCEAIGLTQADLKIFPENGGGEGTS